MSEITIITNNQPRLLIEAYELTAKERSEFDYMGWKAIDKGEESATFFRYKGEIYDLDEFQVAPETFASQGWHGWQSDSFFSGILLKYVNNFEEVIIGRYWS